ncbi:peptidase S8/S53 domain-containing protein [Gorgonomyces haynaldii]|nr:peptidase S8/S53 domain-containing protein [Gorgonomyces haynaldii]
MRDFSNNKYYLVKLHPEQTLEDAHALAQQLSMECLGPVGELENYYSFRQSNNIKRLEQTDTQLETHTEWFSRQIPTKRLFKRQTLNIPQIMAQINITDPDVQRQWHILNGNQVGHDLNITGVWAQGITGKGVTVAFIDDGLDYDHPDLKDNFSLEGSYDYNDGGNYPTPKLYDDKHGTRCAGEVGASKNGIGIVGIAFDAKVAGIRVLSGALTEEDEAKAVNQAFQTTQIYSCSWGPRDDGTTMESPPKAVSDAIVNGVERGRGGLGSIFVFAAGNGAAYQDNCNFDGYTNSIFTVTVSAIDRRHEHPTYSESCSAVLTTTYSGLGMDAIFTTDWDLPDIHHYTSAHSGTSAAAPIASGLYALVLQIRPDLSWRDIQHLTVHSGMVVDESDSGWQKVALGRKFNHKYGFGILKAYKLIETAKTYQRVGKQRVLSIPYKRVNQPVQDSQTVSQTFEITPEMVQQQNGTLLEHITVTLDCEHALRGDISVQLISPHNIVSDILVGRPGDHAKTGFKNWTAMSVVHWDEDPVGNWTLSVTDIRKNSETGNWLGYSLQLFTREPGLMPIPKIQLPSVISNDSIPVKPEIPDIKPTTPETVDESMLQGVQTFVLIVTLVVLVSGVLYVGNRFGLLPFLDPVFKRSRKQEIYEFQELYNADDDEEAFEGRQ